MERSWPDRACAGVRATAGSVPVPPPTGPKRLDPERYREPSDRLCAILSGALLGSIRMTMFFDPDTLSDPDYERELVAIMRQIVTVREDV